MGFKCLAILYNIPSLRDLPMKGTIYSTDILSLRDIFLSTDMIEEANPAGG
jgi:hypothetical protein